ncbi:MAG: hypothetical protein JW803_00460 [Endomicrobiales bacterium]|nr:hypothetical protein [Endomicrobiales bacterium]
MVKRILFSLVLFITVMSAVSRAEDIEDLKCKYVILIADYSSARYFSKLQNIVAKYKDFEMVTAVPPGSKITEEFRELIAQRKVEVPVTLVNEPLLPLIFGARIESEVPFVYSWPRDVWDIILKNREIIKREIGSAPAGIHLRSGVISDKIIPGLSKVGMRWISYRRTDSSDCGAYFREGILLVCVKEEVFTDKGEFFKWVKHQDSNIVALEANERNGLTPDLVKSIAAEARKRDDVRFITPEQVYYRMKHVVPVTDTALEPALGEWVKSPGYWLKLYTVRKYIEEYVNSGEADVETLEKLKGEFYRLYDYRLMHKVMFENVPESVALFDEIVSGICGSLGKDPNDVSQVSIVPEERPLVVESGSNGLKILNSSTVRIAKNIETVSISVNPSTIEFYVALSTHLPQAPSIVDIYMDLNGQNGVGMPKLLPGLDSSFMEPEAAWEYAIRLEGRDVTLYRTGRFEPIVVGKYRAQSPSHFYIMRNVLRGNPLRWGYQVVTADKDEQTVSYVINDFLAKDDKSRQDILAKHPIQLPAVRVSGN